MVYSKEEILRPVIISRYKNVPIFIIEKNSKTASIFCDKYFELLKKS